MWQWLLTTGVVKGLLDAILKQGFSIILLLFACLGLTLLVSHERSEREKVILEMKLEHAQLRIEIRDCHDKVLQYYRDDRKQTDELIQRNTQVMEKLEIQLKSNGR